MKQLDRLSSFYIIVGDTLYYYDADTSDTHMYSGIGMDCPLPITSLVPVSERNTDLHVIKFGSKIELHVQIDNYQVTFPLNQIYRHLLPDKFITELNRRLTEYKSYKKAFYQSIRLKDIWKQLMQLQQRIETLERPQYYIDAV